MACDEAIISSDAIVKALAGPAKAASDGHSAEQHKLMDLIEADRYIRSKCASMNKRRGLRFTRLVPEGTV
jgi:hypothetical protein